jgi:hypothetical protein
VEKAQRERHNEKTRLITTSFIGLLPYGTIAILMNSNSRSIRKVVIKVKYLDYG